MIIPAGPLSRMTLPDLLQEATIRGLQIPANATRPIPIDLIEKYQQPAAPGNPPPPQVQNQTLAQNQAPHRHGLLSCHAQVTHVAFPTKVGKV